MWRKKRDKYANRKNSVKKQRKEETEGKIEEDIKKEYRIRTGSDKKRDAN